MKTIKKNERNIQWVIKVKKIKEMFVKMFNDKLEL